MKPFSLAGLFGFALLSPAAATSRRRHRRGRC